jgi:hypothetical protein
MKFHSIKGRCRNQIDDIISDNDNYTERNKVG